MRPRSLGVPPSLAVFLILFLLCIPLRAHLAPKGDLTLWVGLEPNEAEAVERLAKDFENETGISVKVVMFTDIKIMRSRYRIAAPTGRGPDVLLAPHDWIGEFAEKGIIAPISPRTFREDQQAEFVEKSIEAVSLDGRIWGFPCLLESIVLIYDKEVVAEAPPTWDNLIRQAKDLKGSGARSWGFYYPPADPYYSFPFFSGYGGYVFGEGENVENIGLSTPGAIEGARFIQAMIHENEILPADYTLSPYVVRDSFYGRQVGMIIDGPWTFARLVEEGMDYGVATLPMLPNGEYPRTFVGVQVAMVNADSGNPTAAMELAEYLSSPESQMRLHEAGWRIPTRRAVLSEVENKPEVKAVFEQMENGVLMPKVPEMDYVWTPWTDALRLIVQSKEQDPAEVLADAVAQIKGELGYAPAKQAVEVWGTYQIAAFVGCIGVFGGLLFILRRR